MKFDEKAQIEKLEGIKRSEKEDLAKMLSQKYDIPYLDLLGIPINTNALGLISEKTALDSNIVAFKVTGKILDIAIISPSNSKTKNAIEDLKNKGYQINLYIVSETSIDKAFKRYKEINFSSKTTRGLLDVSNEEIEEFISKVRTIDETKKAVLETVGLNKAHRITKIVETLIAGGISLEASDIHIEPEEDGVKIRFRLDGVLTHILTFDFDTYKLLLSRLKLLSGLKLSIKSNAQDGRFSIHIKETEIEIRTSTIPSEYGESLVMRILNPETISVPIEELGIEPNLLKIIREELKKPNGMLLNTGPTGSGKTTTLYAFLKSVHKEKSKIITIEDPIEYHLDGIVQTQVNRDSGYSFAKGLRSGLRQDPDVIMVGEIRDDETAEIAVHAALTGHLVFSTLHTNNAAGTFSRLIDMKVNPQILSSAINVAMAQRLVRKLCNHCKKEIPIDENAKKIINARITEIENKGLKKLIKNKDKMWAPVGCEKCRNIGYSGRIGVFEAILMNEDIEKLIQNNPSETEISKVASNQKILNMAQDGVLKVLNGVTDIEELERVIEF